VKISPVKCKQNYENFKTIFFFKKSEIKRERSAITDAGIAGNAVDILFIPSATASVQYG
jgi:hypothetical protein